MTTVQADAAGKITMSPLLVDGNENIQATSVNDAGSVVGTVYAPITLSPSGFLISGGVLAYLPAPYAQSGPAHPMTITNDNTIIGWTDSIDNLPTMYVSHDGVVDPTDRFPLVKPNNLGSHILPDPTGIRGKSVFFTTVYSLGLTTANYGTPGNIQTAPALNRFMVAKGLSPSGAVSALAFTYGGPKALYLGSGSSFAPIVPPGATSVEGGLINGPGELAGSYIDDAGAAHGFVLNGDHYTSFDMPQAASEVSVTGINDLGRVVGSYKAASNGVQHLFLWNGTAVTGFGSYDASLNLNVALNQKGEMVVWTQYFASAPRYASFVAVCSGSVC